jgi:hypothetical protein
MVAYQPEQRQNVMMVHTALASTTTALVQVMVVSRNGSNAMKWEYLTISIEAKGIWNKNFNEKASVEKLNE